MRVRATLPRAGHARGNPTPAIASGISSQSGIERATLLIFFNRLSRKFRCQHPSGRLVMFHGKLCMKHGPAKPTFTLVGPAHGGH
jgi:hypothetical protein